VSYPLTDWPIANTQHGLLIAFGEFLQQHGLIQRLMQVPIKQKTRAYAPQTKLVEWLAGIMSGMEYLADLNDGPQPLTNDPLVAQAWGQPGFAHYSGVSRTLDRCDAATVVAVEQAITDFSQPFIANTLQGMLRRGAPLIYDVDLTGQAVSATSTTYPEAAFGWMNEGLKLGYQLARICVSPEDQPRLWLAGFQHPGNTVSAGCLRELVQAAERCTQVRPRRRVELVQQRLADQGAHIERTQRLIAQHQTTVEQLRATQHRLQTQIAQTPWTEKQTLSPRKSQQVAGWQRRLPRLETQWAQAQRMLAEHHARLLEQQSGLTQLRTWQAQLLADNQTNPDPPPYVEVRMDAGFASGENLTWLLEMGYCPNTKAPNGQTTTAWRAQLTPQAHWVRVGDNAEMTALGEGYVHDCPYPLTIAVERFKVGQEFKYATLVHYRDDGVFPTLPAWFQHYNHRQTIEAGNKEMKGTFFVQHLMSRSVAGIQLQVLLTGLAANVVRWCIPWLKSCTPEPTPKFARVLDSPKHLVQVAANSPALVQQTRFGTALRFALDSPFPGVLLLLKGVPAFQLAFGFNQPCTIDSS
jgi:hypothetical protein